MRIWWVAMVVLLGFRAQAAQLSMTVVDAPETGTVYCEVYRTADDFESFRAPFRVTSFSLTDGEPLVVRDLPDGECAVVLFLDENDNGRLDRNFLGIPREPIAFSNGYEPRGPPVFRRARIVLAPEASQEMTLALRRPLGKRGRIGAGVGVLGRSSPYRGGGGAVLQAIPSLSYTGNRVQILGPMAQVGVVGTRRLDLAVKGQYRMGAYDEDDSPALAGLGDRKDTLMAGLGLKLDVAYGFELEADYLHDVLDRVGGGRAGMNLGRSFAIKRGRVSPYLGVQWLSSDLANHDFGVPQAKATPDRPAYAPGSVFQPEAGVGGSLELTEALLVVVRAGVEWLDPDISGSPIVEKHHVISGFAAVTYLF